MILTVYKGWVEKSRIRNIHYALRKNIFPKHGRNNITTLEISPPGYQTHRN